MHRKDPVPLRIAGVPEHFNFPWRRRSWLHTSATGLYDKIQYEEYSGGTGAMAAAMAAGEIDLAILLTEGAILDIAKGGQHRIVKVYVDTPLEWGIHVAANSSFQSIEEIQGGRYAISRFGSGSHIMAAVHASRQQWARELSFVHVKNLSGARAALPAGDADIFFWEKTMTHPFVERGEFRRLGTFQSPWPSFVVCASLAVLEKQAARVKRVLEDINILAGEFQENRDAAVVIANLYEIKPAAAEQWLQHTLWNTDFDLPKDKLQSVLNHLNTLNLGIENQSSIDALVQPL